MPRNKDSTTNLIIKLEGSEINAGVDLFELAPALLALGETIKSSNELLNIDRREIGVNIRPFKKGSFIIDIALFAQNNLQEVLTFASTEKAQQIKTLLEWIGLIGGISGGGTMGLIQVVKWLKGKPPKQIERLKEGDVRYTNYEDNSVTINTNVHSLLQDENIHKNFYLAYGKLLEKEGIDSYESYLRGEENTRTINTKDDLDAFKGYAENALDVIVDEESESIYETHLNFRRGSYEGEKDNWSFKKGDIILTATFKDQSFLDKIQNGEIRPYSRDLLKVKLREKRKIKGTEVLNPAYEIIEVIEYKPAHENESIEMFKKG
jgi:hypothetical protein